MSRHSSRKCSLAIEPQVDEAAPNNPLNAFLLYNNSSNSLAMTSSTDSISPLTPPVSRKNETSYPPPPATTTTTTTTVPQPPTLARSSSLPNLQDTNNTTMLGNRRISICDLNNFNGELYQARHPHLMYLHLSTSDITKRPRNLVHRAKTIHGIVNEVDNPESTTTIDQRPHEDILSPIHFNEHFSHCPFRNHKRRNSVALKFEEPKML